MFSGEPEGSSGTFAAMVRTLILVCALALCACGGPQPTKFDGDYEGEWKSKSIFGDQHGNLVATIANGEVKGFGNNFDLEASFNASGEVNDKGAITLTYIYPGDERFISEGDVTESPRPDGTPVATGVLDTRTEDGTKFGTVRVDLYRQ